MADLDLNEKYEKYNQKNGEDKEIYEIYDATNSKKEKACLKVLNLKNKEFEEEDLNIYKEQIENESKLLKEFNSNNIIKLNEKFNKNNSIILELEYYNTNLYSYIKNSIFEEKEKEPFKNIVRNLVGALKDLKDKGIIHRNIKPQNIFKINSENDFNVKLGNFDCAIYKKDISNSQIMGTFMYMAPEIIKNELYDEKSDIWSLGVALFELYFGVLPFGQNVSINKVKRILYEKEKFIYRKSRIPTLDVLFKRLLTINPKERISLEELINYVENEDFLGKNVIYENYVDLYKEIQKEEQVEYIRVDNEANEDEDKKSIKTIDVLLKSIDFKGINRTDQEVLDENPKFNNILYYDENKKLENVYYDCDNFEENTLGTFIYCNNLESLELIKSDILDKFNENEKYKFNLITSGNSWEKTICKILKQEDYKKFIMNVCIYCNDKKYKDLSTEYDIIKNVCYTPGPVINFIKKYSSTDILPCPFEKVVTYNNYKKNYKQNHKWISSFYDKYDEKAFKENYEELKKLIEEDENAQKLQKSKDVLLKSFENFGNDTEEKLIKIIIKEYTKNTFYKDMNRYLRSLEEKYYLAISYFAGRLMYCLDKYAEKENKYFLKKNKLYRGIKIPFSEVLPYQRAVDKIIVFTGFTSTSEEYGSAEGWAKRRESSKDKQFSVMFYIDNDYYDNKFSNCINVQKIAQYNDEKEILFQAFTFYLVKKVKIDMQKKEADIYLKTIRKTHILEEEMKKGKSFEYDKKNKMLIISD